MTDRLARALQQLPADAVEKVADYAESLAREAAAPTAAPRRFLTLDWAGAAADAYPEHRSGVEAAHAAADMIVKSLDRTTGE